MRNVWIVSVIIVAAVVIGGLLYLYGGPAFSLSSLPQKTDSGFTVIAEGPYAAGIGSRVNYRIRDAGQLEALWKMVYAENGPGVPQVDFSTQEVLAVFDDSHSTGGYGIAVTKVEDTGGKRTVHIAYSVPGERCPLPAGPSSPYQFIVVSKTTVPLAHVDTTDIRQCP